MEEESTKAGVRKRLTRVVMRTRPTDRKTISRLGTPQVPASSQAWGTSDKQFRVVVGAEFSSISKVTKVRL